MNDMLVMFTIFTDAVQFAGMGPDFGSLNNLLAQLSDVLTVNLHELIEMKQDTYWLILNITIAGLIAWLICAVTVIFNIDLRCKNVICRYFG